MSAVLLIEPNQTLGAIYQAALERAGYHVVHAGTAAAGIAALDETSVDVVVLELNLALHNGVEFLYEMRSYADWQDITVILHTNVREAQIESPALERLGVSDYLYKPSTKLVDLVESVGKTLQPTP